jgi:hypothetical protein
VKTSAPAPHYLRVTQALALVSGLGLPLFGCGGREECSTSACEDAPAPDGTLSDSPSGGDVGAAGDAGSEGFGASGDGEVGGDAGAAGDAGFSDGPSGESGDATVGDARDATLDAGPLEPPEMLA